MDFWKLNAANNQMLACFRVIQKLGHEEETGDAQMTSAYNLPAKFVLHAPGPIVHSILTPTHKALLASSYRNCIQLAEKNGCKALHSAVFRQASLGSPKMKLVRLPCAQF